MKSNDITSSSSVPEDIINSHTNDNKMKSEIDGGMSEDESIRSKSESESSDGKDSSEPPPTFVADDAGSSRLFQPHRSLGLLTDAFPHSSKKNAIPPSANPYQAQKGKFHLQPQATSSDETFVTVPIGDRFQILTVSKLVPVLVSRALPPSASHHTRHLQSKLKNKLLASEIKNRGVSGVDYTAENSNEEEIYQALSDASLSITVVTHGPKRLGRAVSVSLYRRTRVVDFMDALPFLEKKDTKKGKQKKKQCWGIVDTIHLGKQRVAMDGEKEGKMENALLVAIVCARGHETSDEDNSGLSAGKGGRDVEVVGEDSDESEESSDEMSEEDSNESKSASFNDSCSSDEDSASDDESSTFHSLHDHEKLPPHESYGRVLLVQASRTSLKIIKTVDLVGVGSNFIPHVGIHPATYVNKIILGGRPTRAVINGANIARGESKKCPTSLLLINIRSGKMIHSFQCFQDVKTKSLKSRKLNRVDSGNAESQAIITALQQSPAVDTIAVGTDNGSVHLINTLHDVKLFTLSHKSKQPKLSHMNAISSLSFRTDGNASRLGVAPLAIGSDDGSITIWDLTPVYEDENRKAGPGRRTLLTQLEGTHYGGISKLEYLPGEPLLLSTGLTSNSILLHVFDAPDHSGRILRQRKGHTSPPQLLRYLHPGMGGGGGILANASDGTDASSCQILSCGGSGDHSLRVFSTARTNLDKEYSQGPGLDSMAKKLRKSGPEGRAELLLPEIVGLVTCDARSRDWGDLVTIHRNHAMAYVWSTKRGAQSGPVLKQSHWNVSAMKERPPREAYATSVAISACGNFALVGTLGGVIYKYNLQSGFPRGSFPRDASSCTEEDKRRRRRGLGLAGDVGRTIRILEKNAMKGGVAASDMDQVERDRNSYLESEARRKLIIDRSSHDEAVVGIAIDSLNKTVVTAGADGKLVLWDFLTHMPHKKSPIVLPSPATKFCHIRDSDLAAIAMNDFGIAVFDCFSLSIVRYFGGTRSSQSKLDSKLSHTAPISDMCFGPDGRRLFSSSLDSTIRVWDVPTGLCVDWMAFSTPPTSLALSPTGEFLATSHADRLGISLWCDKSFFRMVMLDGIPSKPANMNEPCPVAECEQEGSSEALNRKSHANHPKKESVSSDVSSHAFSSGVLPWAKKPGLITLSGLPPGRWKNLFHLELVKERNKPSEAPKKPPKAPFFLQWRSGIESVSATDNQAGAKASLSNEIVDKDRLHGWDAVWSDDDAEDVEAPGNRGVSEKESTKIISPSSSGINKRRKVAHYRSRLAEILNTCTEKKDLSSDEVYSDVTSYLSTMGPSSIDVEIASLCYGIHDLDEGLPLLHLASLWLLEACESHQSFEAVNAYLHRFLHVHGNVITRIRDTLKEERLKDEQSIKLTSFVETITCLRNKQCCASNRLQEKMQHSLCLLRHLSRMV